jgi:hypothetical protein
MALALSYLGVVRHRQAMTQEAKACFLQAYDLATEMQSLSVALEALVGLAGVRVQEGSIEPVLELFVHVMNHPASNQRTKDRVQELRVGLAALLTPQQLQAARTRAQAQPFETVVAEILAMR